MVKVESRCHFISHFLSLVTSVVTSNRESTARGKNDKLLKKIKNKENKRKCILTRRLK